MDKLNTGYYTLNDRHSYYVEKIPIYIFQQIENLVSNTNKNLPANSGLAGEIKEEYRIPAENIPPMLERYIANTCEVFEDHSNFLKDNVKVPMRLKTDGYWINFQKKYEYNPMHIHSGIYSFVIWYKVPYSLEAEYQYSTKSKFNHNYSDNGQFVFVYNHPNTNQIVEHTLGVDNDAEGYICVFPATLSHQVYPFYSSDDYRISISGNILGITGT